MYKVIENIFKHTCSDLNRWGWDIAKTQFHVNFYTKVCIKGLEIIKYPLNSNIFGQSFI